MNFSKSMSLIALMLLFSINAVSQGSTEFVTKRNLGFKESSKVQTVNVDVQHDTKELRLMIKCNVRVGNVTIEIFNPVDIKQGEFSVESLETENDDSIFSMLKEGVSGQISKQIEKPFPGKWKIKFTPENASGVVEIHSFQNM